MRSFAYGGVLLQTYICRIRLQRASACHCIATSLTHYGRIKSIAEQRVIMQQYGDWYTGRLWVGCYIWYSKEGPRRAGAPPSPILAVPDVTSTASVPTLYYLMWRYNCL